AYDAQVAWNKVQADLKQESQLSNDKNADPNKRAALITQIQADEANYAQAGLSKASVNDLLEDVLIQRGARQAEQQSRVPATTFTPARADVDKALQSFKAAFPVGETYADFLSKNGLNDLDVRTALTLHLRRDLMQKYLQAQLNSPTRQVHLRHIEVGSAADAQKVRDLIVNQRGDWTALAKRYSLDVNSKNNGGDLGWVPPGTGEPAVDLWAYDAGRKLNDISPVLKNSTGTYDVVQLLEVQASRGYDQNLLSGARQNALDHWLNGQRVAPFTRLTTPIQDMLDASRNMPVVPNLNAQLPNFSPPGGIPGGIPGGGNVGGGP
ncbi:MAG: peptidylprolyl isomerase, partial [Ktedonobacterales bacterium]|nr:peptidylprolyl isomerase [Ktedonobacterales bacterium]